MEIFDSWVSDERKIPYRYESSNAERNTKSRWLIHVEDGSGSATGNLSQLRHRSAGYYVWRQRFDEKRAEGLSDHLCFAGSPLQLPERAIRFIDHVPRSCRSRSRNSARTTARNSAQCFISTCSTWASDTPRSAHDNSVGSLPTIPNAPVYKWHANDDILIPLEATASTMYRYCDAGVRSNPNRRGVLITSPLLSSDFQELSHLSRIAAGASPTNNC